MYDGRAHLLIGTHDGTKPGQRFWMDGVEYTTFEASSAMPGSTPCDYVSIGARNWGVTPNKDLGRTGDFLFAAVLFGHTITDAQVRQLNADWFGPFRQARRLWQLAPLSTAVVLTQSRFRWRNDDGSESGATWAEAEGDDETITPGGVRRLRMQVAATGNPASGVYKLQVRKQGAAAWTDVTVE